MVNANASQVENGTDTIKVENTDVRLTVVVDRPKKLAIIFGYMKQVPYRRFEGEIFLDFSKPETKADGNMFVDIFARMMKQYSAIASLLKEKIVY